MAQIDPVLVIVDIPPATPGNPAPNATTTIVAGIVKSFSIKWKLSSPEDMALVVNGADVNTLTPGRPPNGTRLIGISLDGGNTVECSMLSGGVQALLQYPAEASETGSANSIGACLGTTHVFRLTAQQVRLQDVFTGQRGSVRRVFDPAKPPGLITRNKVLPYFQGIQYTPVSPDNTTLQSYLAFSWIIDQAAAWLPLDIDVNRDTQLRITTAVAERLGSYIDPQQAQFVIDSGDWGLDSANPKKRTVMIAHKGTTPKLTFRDFLNENTNQPILLGTQAQAQATQMCRSCSFKGGDTHHGLPGSGTLTDITTINVRLNDATGNYRSGLPVIAIYGDQYHGGVYYWPGDNTLHNWSQAMGVTTLWYDESISTIHAGTEAGVYRQTSDPLGTGTRPWPRVGGMAWKVLKVQSAPFGLPGAPSGGAATLFALVQVGPTSNATTHILQENSNATPGYSYDGWESVYSTSNITDFTAMSVVDDAGHVTCVLYCISPANAGYVTRHVVRDDTGIAGTVDQRIDLWTDAERAANDGPVAIGLDPIVQFTTVSPDSQVAKALSLGTYVRTTVGSNRLFFFDGIGTVPFLVPTMVDAYGIPVQVNHVICHGAGKMLWTLPTGVEYVNVLVIAFTSAGAFVSPTLRNGPWQRTDDQSNIGDVNIKRGASAPPRPWAESATTPAIVPPKRYRSPIYGIGDAAFYISEDGTVTWRDAFTEQLDAGPAFAALWKASPLHPAYPGNNDTSITYPPGNQAGHDRYTLIRELDGLSQYQYTLVNPHSAAPAAAHRDAEITQISAPALVPEVPLSQLLVDAMVRFLDFTSQPQTIVEVVSTFSDTADPLRTLRPTHMANVDGTISEMVSGLSPAPIVFVTYANESFYVLEHTIAFDADQDTTACTTTSKLGKLLLDDRSDPMKVSSDTFFAMSRLQLYRTKGHR